MTVKLLLGIMACLWLWGGCDQPGSTGTELQPPEPAYIGTILAVGDSLTAGYGLEETEGYPAVLQQLLMKNGTPYRVVNAGISGETSSGLKSRIEWALTIDPVIVIIETGANDALRGIPPALIKSNLESIIRTIQKRHIPIVLAGMRIFRNLGKDYADAFERIYPDLAEAHDLILVPFFLKGIAGRPDLNQKDGMHPTADGYRIIAETIYPQVREAMARANQKPD